MMGEPMALGIANLEAFSAALCELATDDANVIVVTSDSRGSGKLMPFAERFPKQIVEVGIAEQNLVGVAAGLASTGKTVFAVSPACFLTARALEQIKNDVCYSDNPVTLVGISAGVSYGALGSTHHSIHDLAALRAIHNIDVVVPADNFETQAAIRAAAAADHPVFVRFGKRAMHHVHGSDTQFEIGKAMTVREGSDGAFVATGETVEFALMAAMELAKEGIDCRVVSMHTVKPLDVDAVLDAAETCGTVVTVEEHSVHGGLGEACASALLQAGMCPGFRIVGLPDAYTVTGGQLEILGHYGISVDGLVAVMREVKKLQIANCKFSIANLVFGDSVMAERYVLAIDQGTSGTKALVFDGRGRIAAKGTAALDSIYPRPGFVEQDPEGIYRSAMDAVRACLDEFSGDRSAIAACGISNQRETFLLWDRSGKPLHHAVVWQCNRSVAICNRLKDEGLESEVRDRTGLILDPYFSGTKAIYLYEEDEAVRAAIDAGEALFGTVDAWLLYRLTNGACYRTDYTNASRTLLFNIHDLVWDATLLKAFGLTGLQLPEARPSADAYGRSDFEGLFPEGLDIGAMIGDSHASAFGQCCFEPGSAKVTMGTGSSILMDTGQTVSRSQTGMMSTICWSTPERVDYALEGIIISCGSTLTWLRDQLGLYGEIDELVQAPDRVADNAGVCLIPAFSGLGAPHWRMDAKAKLVGLTFGAERDHVLRAALESIPFQIKDVMDAMASDAGIPVQVLMADGGISKNEFVMQLLANLLDASVVQRGMEEVSAFGAACLAGLTAGVFDGLDHLKTLDTSPKVYEPNADQSVDLNAYAGWQTALEA